MDFSATFIKATNEFNTFENNVPAPYLRKSFFADVDTTAKIVIAVCGFYELYINGENLTKGFLAPYISNTDDYIYCDEYEVPIKKGENVIGIFLGNGFQNNPGGFTWYFEKAPFRSAPMVALELSFKNSEGNEIIVQSDKTFKTCESPLRSDDYRFGVFYDANHEIDGWNNIGFDDSAWQNAIETNSPRGELRLCTAEPIVCEKELKPIEIFKDGSGFTYKFAENNAGVCRLKINGKKGQKITLLHGEVLIDGKLNIDNIWFEWDFDKPTMQLVHKDTYICKGGAEIFTPSFVYHGFQYVKVEGITEEQATKDLLTFVVIHSDIKSRGGFNCSDPVANKIQEMVRRSDISNFHYFPTDCPHREKNGWTGDAAFSCEQLTLNFAPEISYREWLYNICKAQNKAGALPGIVPTTGWGYHWGNGPAWDWVLAQLPYYTYIYRGETDMITESAASFVRYLHYITTKKDENGLIHIGLGDWCSIADDMAPLEVTDTAICIDIATKMAFMFDVVGMIPQRDFARAIAEDFRNAARQHLIDFDTMLVAGNQQSSQAMFIYFKIFNEDEMLKAVEKLVEIIHRDGDFLKSGVLGGRTIFHALSEYGYSDLAYKMITRPEFPSYGSVANSGATTLLETFATQKIDSLNHHMWGDVSAWFIKRVAGLQFNPTGNDINSVNVKPSFINALDFAESYYDAPAGRIFSSWKRDGENIVLNIQIPQEIKATVILDKGYCFVNGNSVADVCSGEYIVKKYLN